MQVPLSRYFLGMPTEYASHEAYSVTYGASLSPVRVVLTQPMTTTRALIKAGFENTVMLSMLVVS